MKKFGYKEWHKEIIEKSENKEKAYFILNEAMFLLGKKIKSVYGDRKNNIFLNF